MIDRVADAAYTAWLEAAKFWIHGEPGDPWRIVARAAIAAMREPTPEMLNAFDNIVGSPEGEGRGYPCWQAMIDAALAESGEAGH